MSVTNVGKNHSLASTVSRLAAHGMRVQSARLKLIAENLANSESSAPSPDVLPYQRKMLVAENKYDPNWGESFLHVVGVVHDKKPFKKIYRPYDPGADADGFVNVTNVEHLMELMDMRESLHTHSANLKVYEAENERESQTLELLR